MTALAGFLALSALIAWLVRQPSAELFEEADTYYRAAERWERAAEAGDEQPGGVTWSCASERNACLQTAAALTRKALRRMPLRLL